VEGNVVLITGASSGIGEACAFEFAKNGARLILVARRKDRLEKITQELIDKYSSEIHLLELDVTAHDKIKTAIASLPDEWQKIDLLINNAGLSLGLDKIQDGKIDDWHKMIDTNIKGLLFMTREILPQMVERKSGHVINIGSISSHEVYAGGVVYCATKHAERALSNGLRYDLLGTNVRVTSVDPGAVVTEYSLVRFNGDKERADNVYKNMTPLSAADIAETVYYCASRPAHINVQDIIVMPTDQASVHATYRHE
jgi:3-hydroxy acid dehydrogenase/malonic semialdehyde reductase